MAEFEMKLMDIDQEHLGIPDTTYDAEIKMPSAEFARIVRDLTILGESVKIEVTKEGVKFTADGDLGSGTVTLRPTAGSGDRRAGSTKPKIKKSDSDDENAMDEDEDKKPDVRRCSTTGFCGRMLC